MRNARVRRATAESSGPDERNHRNFVVSILAIGFLMMASLVMVLGSVAGGDGEGGQKLSIFTISPENVIDVVYTNPGGPTDDSRDELRSANVTFLEAGEGAGGNYTFSIVWKRILTVKEFQQVAFPENTKFVSGYYSIELEDGFPAFSANVSIELHISQRSQLGSRTSDILENLRIVRRKGVDAEWAVLEVPGRELEPVNESAGLYRISTIVSEFGEFAVVLAQADLIVRGVRPGANPAMSGQEMRVSVVVRNVPMFAKMAVDDIHVKLFVVDADRNQEFIGEIDLGSIDPNVDYHPNRDDLRPGEREGWLNWTTSTLISYGEVQVFTLRAQVDPDGYVRESIETNNERSEPVEVIGGSGGCYHGYGNSEGVQRQGAICFSGLITLLAFPVIHAVIWKRVG
jgi:hypothetical protein